MTFEKSCDIGLAVTSTNSLICFTNATTTTPTWSSQSNVANVIIPAQLLSANSSLTHVTASDFKFGQKINHKNKNIFGTGVGIRDFWCQWAATDRPKHFSWACRSYDWSNVATVLESQRNSSFHTFCKLVRVLCTRSLVPKVADSNCGAEKVPVFEIYFWGCFCSLVSLEMSDKAGLEYLDWQGRGSGWRGCESGWRGCGSYHWSNVTIFLESQRNWNVPTFCQLPRELPRVFWTVSTRSYALVPKVADSNCAENVPIFESYFSSCFCALVCLKLSDKAGLRPKHSDELSRSWNILISLTFEKSCDIGLAVTSKITPTTPTWSSQSNVANVITPAQLCQPIPASATQPHLISDFVKK